MTFKKDGVYSGGGVAQESEYMDYDKEHVHSTKSAKRVWGRSRMESPVIVAVHVHESGIFEFNYPVPRSLLYAIAARNSSIGR